MLVSHFFIKIVIGQRGVAKSMKEFFCKLFFSSIIEARDKYFHELQQKVIELAEKKVETEYQQRYIDCIEQIVAEEYQILSILKDAEVGRAIIYSKIKADKYEFYLYAPYTAITQELEEGILPYQFKMEFRLNKNSKTIIINDIEITETNNSFANLGIKEFINFAKQKEIAKIDGNVVINNKTIDNMKDFYQKNGFEVELSTENKIGRIEMLLETNKSA